MRSKFFLLRVSPYWTGRTRTGTGWTPIVVFSEVLSLILFSFKVYDGSLDEDALFETLCGAVVPPKITSTSSMLFVSFYSHENSTNLGSGFEAVYSQFDGICKL